MCVCVHMCMFCAWGDGEGLAKSFPSRLCVYKDEASELVIIKWNELSTSCPLLTATDPSVFLRNTSGLVNKTRPGTRWSRRRSLSLSQNGWKGVNISFYRLYFAISSRNKLQALLFQTNLFISIYFFSPQGPTKNRFSALTFEILSCRVLFRHFRTISTTSYSFCFTRTFDSWCQITGFVFVFYLISFKHH